MPNTATATTATDRASHAAEPPRLCTSSPDRARTPEIAWLPTKAGLPGLLVLKTTLVQYRTESCPATMNPAPVTAANETAAVPAARQQLGPRSVPGDPALLERLITNLVANAVVYNEPVDGPR